MLVNSREGLLKCKIHKTPLVCILDIFLVQGLFESKSLTCSSIRENTPLIEGVNLNHVR